MKFTTTIAALVVAAATTISSVAAVPVAAANLARDVWDPKILYPNKDTTWVSGQTYTVVWYVQQLDENEETADQPKEITNPNGHIILAGGGQEYQVVLAWNFDIRDGHVEVTVPPMTARLYIY
ncbi:hypothetical protein EIP86_004405 [Pleurotus ostreatoroseus]|nr:hypothetical protein EIP86_004405 [Pleurotus ostreatoroseus]